MVQRLYHNPLEFDRLARRISIADRVRNDRAVGQKEKRQGKGRGQKLMLDFEKYYHTKSLLEEYEKLRNSPDYESYLSKLSEKGDYEKREIALHILSQKDFSEIKPYEENYVLSTLESGDLLLQEEALNAFLLWENTTQLERVKKVKIANSYLQEDLDEFIAEIGNKQRQ